MSKNDINPFWQKLLYRDKTKMIKSFCEDMDGALSRGISIGIIIGILINIFLYLITKL
jgi:hypothetical protein